MNGALWSIRSHEPSHNTDSAPSHARQGCRLDVYGSSPSNHTTVSVFAREHWSRHICKGAATRAVLRFGARALQAGSEFPNRTSGPEAYASAVPYSIGYEVSGEPSAKAAHER